MAKISPEQIFRRRAEVVGGRRTVIKRNPGTIELSPVPGEDIKPGPLANMSVDKLRDLWDRADNTGVADGVAQGEIAQELSRR